MKKGSVVMLNMAGSLQRSEEMKTKRGQIVDDAQGERFPVRWSGKKEVWWEHRDFIMEDSDSL